MCIRDRCKAACPAHVAVQGYIRKAKEGKYQEALALIKKDNPFPAICGRVCNKRCEAACTRGTIDQAAVSYTHLDGEAGIEQINRRVMEKVTHLVLITDTSRKGTQVVQTIRKVADELVMYEQAGIIINRVPDESIVQYMDCLLYTSRCV